MPVSDEVMEGEPSAEFSTEVGYLRKILDALDSVRDEGKIVITDDNIYSKVVDPSNAMMCVCRIKGRALNGIRVEDGDRVILGDKYNALHDILSGFSKNSEVLFQFPIEDMSKRNIKLNVVDEDATFYRPTLDVSTVPSIPQDEPMEHNTRIVVSGGELKKTIKHAEKMIDVEAGYVVFGTEEDTFYVESSDTVSGKFRKDFYQSGPSEGSESFPEMRTMIGFGFLDDIQKTLGRSEEVTVHIRDSHPLRFDVDLDDEGNAQIVYVIAPRVDDQ